MPNATAGGARVVHVPAAAGHGDQRIAAERAPASYTAEKGAASSRMKAGVSYRIVYSVPDGQHHTLTAVAVYWLPTANKEVQKRERLIWSSLSIALILDGSLRVYMVHLLYKWHRVGVG